MLTPLGGSRARSDIRIPRNSTAYLSPYPHFASSHYLSREAHVVCFGAAWPLPLKGKHDSCDCCALITLSHRNDGGRSWLQLSLWRPKRGEQLAKAQAHCENEIITHTMRTPISGYICGRRATRKWVPAVAFPGV